MKFGSVMYIQFISIVTQFRLTSCIINTIGKLRSQIIPYIAVTRSPAIVYEDSNGSIN